MNRDTQAAFDAAKALLARKDARKTRAQERAQMIAASKAKNEAAKAARIADKHGVVG